MRATAGSIRLRSQCCECLLHVVVAAIARCTTSPSAVPHVALKRAVCAVLEAYKKRPVRSKADISCSRVCTGSEHDETIKNELLKPNTPPQNSVDKPSNTRPGDAEDTIHARACKRITIPVQVADPGSRCCTSKAAGVRRVVMQGDNARRCGGGADCVTTVSRSNHAGSASLAGCSERGPCNMMSEVLQAGGFVVLEVVADPEILKMFVGITDFQFYF